MKGASAVLVILILVILVVLGALGFIYSGIYSVAADEPDPPGLVWFLTEVRERSVNKRAAEIVIPNGYSAIPIAEGASHYALMCAGCHGAPGTAPSPVGLGLNPRPPDLREAAGDLKPAEIFWIVKHGIKMTGMPSFGASIPDDEIWATAALVQKLPSLNVNDYRDATRPGSPSPLRADTR